MDLHISHVSFKETALPSSDVLNSETNKEAVVKFSEGRKLEPSGPTVGCDMSEMTNTLKSFWTFWMLSLLYFFSLLETYEVKSQSFVPHSQSLQGLGCHFCEQSPDREVPGSRFLIPRRVSNVCCFHLISPVLLSLSLTLGNGPGLSDCWRVQFYLSGVLTVQYLAQEEVKYSKIFIDSVQVIPHLLLKLFKQAVGIQKCRYKIEWCFLNNVLFSLCRLHYFSTSWILLQYIFHYFKHLYVETMINPLKTPTDSFSCDQFLMTEFQNN